MNVKRILVSALIVCATAACAQMPTKPGPEVKKLEYFVGTWNVEATIPQGPWGNGGKFTSTDTTDWMPGNFFTESHSDFKMPVELGGDGKETAIMGYDTDQNTYTYNAFNSQGHRESSKGTLANDTWTWTSSANYGGQEVQQKLTMKMVSPTSYTMKFEVSIDGTNWMTFMDGKATKK